MKSWILYIVRNWHQKSVYEIYEVEEGHPITIGGAYQIRVKKRKMHFFGKDDPIEFISFSSGMFSTTSFRIHLSQESAEEAKRFAMESQAEEDE